MNLTFLTPPTGGTISAIPSKSAAHRLLICAAFADAPTEILCPATNEDIDATARSLRALGADIRRTADGFFVTPIQTVRRGGTADCGESGSTLRFLLPIAAAIRAEVDFVRHGRLASRPLSPLYEELCAHGAILPDDPQTEPLPVRGKLTPGDYTLAANVSSQFISGLLMAMPLMGGHSTLSLTGKIESADYIRITTAAMAQFGVQAERSPDERRYSIEAAGYRSPGKIAVEGDWSNAALWLAVGAVGKCPITVTGLNAASPQGDRRIAEILAAFGADVQQSENACTVRPRPLHGITLDAAQIPDLVPVLSAVAAAAEGETVITGIARLRIKESDRAAAVTEQLTALGAQVQNKENALIIRGGKRLHGAVVPSFGDHRMVMCACAASLIADSPITVENAHAIAKSYPGFPADLAALGGTFATSEDA